MDAAVVAKDTVVCGFENENMEWCLAVWRGWGTREFDVFYQSYEELGRLEACTRKKRSPATCQRSGLWLRNHTLCGSHQMTRTHVCSREVTLLTGDS
ncbi:leucine-rich repeat serine/threonine-protein kinase 1-like [Pteropus vampyrus]|uniref:Leucine-rich repeat serine/threonine-protein kinase 1-like n=1 Tax=Pteropus vampyrus TaxID=132908 RepID=A0A6P3RI58_PTEVA|nr:leucine-rich repeat serine/threonine-protein kinase 1-like [Pteropus vampyrus]